MKWILTFLLLFSGYCLYSQTDYWACLVYFSGCPVNHIPKGITLPDRDKKSRAVMNAIIDGSSYTQLQQKYPDSLDLKLEKLIAGKVIEREGDGFRILFPVLTGKKREELRAMIHNRLDASGFSAGSLILPLKKAFTENPEMIFHFLWSRIMDDCWWNMYNAAFKTETGPPGIAFLVYPPHPYQCGTNSDYTATNDMYAMSWSYNIFDEFFAVPSTRSFFDLAAGKEVKQSDLDFFRKYGLADPAGRSLVYTYRVDDPLDRLCDSLKDVYVSMVKGLFNYQDLGNKFDIPPDELFLVVSHEVAYEVIGMLDEKKPVFIPITLKNNPDRNFRYLVSIRYQK